MCLLDRLDSVGYWPKTSKTPQTKVTLFESTANGPREKQLKVKHGTDLVQQTNRTDYEGYLTTSISAEPGNEYVEFQNGIRIEPAKASGAWSTNGRKVSFAKEKSLKGKGIKVLSLFFKSAPCGK